MRAGKLGELGGQFLTIVHAGGTTADTAFDVPTGTPPIEGIVSGVLATITQADGKFAATALTVVDDAATIGDDEISLVDYNSLRTGKTVTELSLLIVTVKVASEGYSGKAAEN
jgi:hypothetical protein